MDRFFWSILFLLVPILGVAVFLFAAVGIWPLENNYWLPENINENREIIDTLYMFILWLTGIIFIGTGGAMFWFMWKYAARKNPNPVIFSHGSHTLEVVWSVLPAVTLLFIAIYQMNAWADAKLRRPTRPGPQGTEEPMPPLARITGRQFEWRIQYAGPDEKLDTRDDLYTVNELHVPVNQEVVIQIESEDVLHSFFLPHVRVKQDVVPGMRQFVWFQANKQGIYDIVCAELCGWGHYKMRGRLTVQDDEAFAAYLTQLKTEQNRTTLPEIEEEEEE